MFYFLIETNFFDLVVKVINIEINVILKLM